ncbi:BCCT family transporter [Cobetia crustatorum]|uniref:BCCT family transporter n=1 Tax=Cobetia crustatorum TaxID=553385 RepID=UPI0004B40600|nr:BCCT family transporter [Cobetia crustatorum]
MVRSIRHLVFWPTFLVLIAAVIASLMDLEAFLGATTALNTLILDNFAWLFSLAVSIC